jgi:hypothetical protein
VYGVDMVYPIDHAEALRALTNTKTLSQAHMLALSCMGFTFEKVIADSIITPTTADEFRYERTI